MASSQCGLTWLLVLLASVGLSCTPTAIQACPSPCVWITDFNAKGDGITLNTDAIAAAISAASHQQGNNSGADPIYVGVPAGIFLSAQISLLDSIMLWLEPNATLLAATQDVTLWQHLQPDQWIFVWGYKCTGCGIQGTGTIDGGKRWFVKSPEEGGWDDANDKFIPGTWEGVNGCTGECRPRAVQFRSSYNITLTGVTVTESPDWTIHIWDCEYVQVDGVISLGDERWPNNDGIDIDSSSHVFLTNMYINTADDGICIKSSDLDMYDVHASNCWIRSRSSAIKIGSATPMNMYDMTFRDITIHDSNCGLGIQARDGGAVHNILYENITMVTRQSPTGWWGTGEAIWVSSMPRDPSTHPGTVYNITFQDITATSQNTASLSGIAPGNIIHDITLSNVTITIDRLPPWNYSHPDLDYRPTSSYPNLIPHPTEGIHIEGCLNCQLSDVSIQYNMKHQQPYWTNPFNCLNTTLAGNPVSQYHVTCNAV